MEELPDELVVKVFAELNPVRDTAAVNLTCRRWLQLFFPTHFAAPASDNADDLVPPPGADWPRDLGREFGVVGSATEEPWRRRFAAKVRQLQVRLVAAFSKALVLRCPANGKWAKARGSSLSPTEVTALTRVVAAADVGSVVLARRWIDELSQASASAPPPPGESLLSGTRFVAKHSWDRKGWNVSVVSDCLYRACRAGSSPTAKLFLDLGAHVSCKEGRRWPLLAAAASGNTELVALLLERDTETGFQRDVYAQELFPLEVAAKLGYTDMVRLLAHRGAKCDKDRLERHPVALAANNGHIDTVKLLLEMGYYEPSHVNKQNQAALSMTALRRSRKNESYHAWRHKDMIVRLSPHLQAAQRGDVAMVRLFIEHGINVMHVHLLAALNREGEPDMELLEPLVRGIEPEHSFDLMTSAAVARGDTGVCRFLLAHGADIDALRQGCKQTERCSALQHAAREGRTELARCLLQCGADKSLKSPGVPAVAASIARQYGHSALAKLIASATPTPVNKRNRSEETCENDAGKKEAKKRRVAADEDNEEEAQENSVVGEQTTEAGKKRKRVASSDKKSATASLETEVRCLAGLNAETVVDTFMLRRLLAKLGMTSRQMPTRKAALMAEVVARLTSGEWRQVADADPKQRERNMVSESRRAEKRQSQRVQRRKERQSLGQYEW